MLANMTSDSAYNIHGQRARQHACLCEPLCRAATGEAAGRLARILEEVRDCVDVHMVLAPCAVNHCHKRDAQHELQQPVVRQGNRNGSRLGCGSRSKRTSVCKPRDHLIKTTLDKGRGDHHEVTRSDDRYLATRDQNEGGLSEVPCDEGTACWWDGVLLPRAVSSNAAHMHMQSARRCASATHAYTILRSSSLRSKLRKGSKPLWPMHRIL